MRPLLTVMALMLPLSAAADDTLSQIELALAEIRVEASRRDAPGRVELLQALRDVIRPPGAVIVPLVQSDTKEVCTRLVTPDSASASCISASEVHGDGPDVVEACHAMVSWHLGSAGTLMCLDLVRHTPRSPTSLIKACHNAHGAKFQRDNRLPCVERFAGWAFDAAPAVELCDTRVLGTERQTRCEERLAALRGDPTVGIASCDRYLGGSKYDEAGSIRALKCVERLHQAPMKAPQALLKCTSERIWSDRERCLDTALGKLE